MRYSNKPSRSRLYKQIERKSKKSFIINILGIIAAIFLLAKFGLPMLINFTLFVSGSRNSEQNIKKHDSSFISPPILNPMPTATNSAEIVVSGSSLNSKSINLYLNDNLVDSTKPEKNGAFSFKITLEKKENSIKTKASDDNIESEFSESIKISFSNSPPTLSINSPTDGESFSKEQNTIEVKGQTDALAKVTVNDFWAITDQANHFLYSLTLKNGDNQIKITATDQAGNKTEKSLKVSYSP